MDSISSYSAVIDSLIAQQMSVLGPDITLAKVSRVPEIRLDESGKVVDIAGNPQEALTKLINEFVELSGLIVKKTLASIIAAQTQAQYATTTEVMQQAHQAPQASTPVADAEVVNVLQKAMSGLNPKAS